MADHRIKPPANWRNLTDRELAWAVLKRIWKWADFYGKYAPFKKQMAELTPGQRAVYATMWCTAEVDNGGFWQFFGNSTGMLAPEAVDGFRLIGMAACAKRVLAAISFARLKPYPRERGKREDRIFDLETDLDAWEDAVDAPFYAANKKLHLKQAAYIRAHPDEFFLP